MPNINEQALKIALSIDDALAKESLDNLETKVIDFEKNVNTIIQKVFSETVLKIQDHMKVIDSSFANITASYNTTNVAMKQAEDLTKQMQGLNLLNLQTFKKHTKAFADYSTAYNKYAKEHKKDNLIVKDDLKQAVALDKNIKILNKDLDNKNKLHKDQNEYLQTDNVLLQALIKPLNNIIGHVREYAMTTEGSIKFWKMIISSVLEADQATENFITTNYRLYGSQYELVHQSRMLSAEIGVTEEKAIEAYKALANVSTPIAQMDALAVSIAKASTYLGVSIDQLAEFSRQNRVAGGSVEEAERMLNMSAAMMKQFGLNSSEVGKILTGTKMSVDDLTLSFGKITASGKIVNNVYKEQMMVLAGFAKQMGRSTEAAASLFEANASAMNKMRLSKILGRNIDAENYGAAVDSIGLKLNELGIDLEKLNDPKLSPTERARMEQMALGRASIFGIKTTEEMMIALERAKMLRKEGVKGATDFEKIMEVNAKVAKEMADPFNEANNTITRQLAILQNTIHSLLADAFMEFKDPFIDFLKMVNSVAVPVFKMLASVIKGIAIPLKLIAIPIKMAIGAFNGLITAIKKARETSYYAEFIVTLLENLGEIGGWLTGIVGKLGGAFIGFTMIARTLGLGPIGLGFSLLASGIYLAYENWDLLVKALKDNFPTEMIDWLKSFRDMLYSFNIEYWTENWEKALALLVAATAIGAIALIKTITMLKTRILSMFDVIDTGASKTSTKTTNVVQKMSKSITDTFTSLIDSVIKIATRLVDGFRSIVKSIGDVLVTVSEIILKVAKNIGKALHELVRYIKPKDVLIFMGMAAAMYIFAKAAQVIAQNLWPTVIAMGAMVLAFYLFGKALVAVTKGLANPQAIVGTAILVVAMLALSAAAWILAKAFEVVLVAITNVYQPLIALIEAFANNSAVQVLATGTAFAAALGLVGVAAGLAVTPLTLISFPLGWLAGLNGMNLLMLGLGVAALAKGLLIISGVDYSKVDTAYRSIKAMSKDVVDVAANFIVGAPAIAAFGMSLGTLGSGANSAAGGIAALNAVDYKGFSAGIIGLGTELSANVDTIVSPITLIAESIERLNSAITEFMSKSIDNISKLAPAIKDITGAMQVKPIKSEMVVESKIPTTVVGGDTNKPQGDGSISELRDTMVRFMEQAKKMDDTKIAIMNEQLAAMAGGARTNMTTEYNSWIN
jgi:hypothetical protein